MTARLAAAYVNNAGNLGVVVEEMSSADREVRTDNATYSPPDGYQAEDTAYLSTKVPKGGKALTSFTFPKSVMGGKMMRLEVGRLTNSNTSYDLGALTLSINGTSSQRLCDVVCVRAPIYGDT